MELPARIGKYELEEFLGGGMSHVYRARDTVIGRTVAVKILTEQGCADDEVKARFLAEARMAGNLSHDNILSIYDFGEDEQKRPFMVMEFLRGQDLRGAIRGGNTGDTAGKLRIALQVARALEYTHSQKIIHRDLKPENVHINSAGVVKLIDFGIAKAEGLQMTRAGYILGTPFYMAPEQVMGSNMTEQVDVYAFGILLFELFAGDKPIQADTVQRLFYLILNEPLNLEPLQRANVPQSIIDLVARCTAKKPEDRPQGFGPIVAELERAASARDEATLVLPAATVTMVAPAVAAPPSKRPAWILPIVLVAIAGLAAALYFATRPKAAPPPPVAAVPKGMVLIPKGIFLFGEQKERVDLPDYYIDKTEVSNADYAEYCKAKNLPQPSGQPDLPVVDVTIQDARDFATWAGKRLPIAQEWEKAARGKDGLTYPWGNEEDKARANVAGTALQPVTAHPEGKSPYDVLQMVGNVWEYIDEKRTPTAQTLKHFKEILHFPASATDQWFAARGLSFEDSWNTGVVYEEALNPAAWKSHSIGFRCVKDFPAP
jgi:serine/threonine-protein kinase